jgi:hypothetical protein
LSLTSASAGMLARVMLFTEQLGVAPLHDFALGGVAAALPAT